MSKPKKSVRYADAGVNIDEADRAVSAIKKLARATFTPRVLTGIGSFGAMYALEGYKKPVLISSADGVGTKLKVAQMAGRHETIGEDLVNHCVNDIAVQGARPLYFLDYFAVGALDAAVCASVVKGLARGCKRNGCALIGGETAEMPGFYQPGEYDVAGFIVGAAERSQLLTGDGSQVGDVLVGLPSTGLHTNGYSLARRIFFADLKVDSVVPELGITVADELLKVHRSYLKTLLALQAEGLVRGAAHITGGGMTDNIPRVLPKGLGVEIEKTSWPVLPVFEALRERGNIPEDDWRRTFNLGIGMVLVIPAKKLAAAQASLKKLREKHYVIGRVLAAKGERVRYV
ncbi:MAG: phosphoribosylformylglycinamidine cyclo-ligase [Bryobacteraceae bacterium]|nr:phosphoribosylformylglycinamidine cyclo-ligase [Bryobacteraceae bacterium]